MTEKEMLAKLKKSREQGKFRDADDVISDMRSKYGL
jgi:DNA-damage-inducible protein J